MLCEKFVSCPNIASYQESVNAFALVFPILDAGAPVRLLLLFLSFCHFYVSLMFLFVVSYENSLTYITYMSLT